MEEVRSLSRRNLLAVGAASAVVTAAAAANAASFGNPDEPPEGAVNVTNPKGWSTPVPRTPTLQATSPLS